MRFCAILVIAALLFASLPVVAEGPGPAKPLIPFDRLAASSSSQPDPAAVQAAMNNSGSSSSQNVKKRHWSHGGKIMTFIGVPVLAAGGAMLAYGLKNGDSSSCSGNTCVSVSWKYTGAAWLGVGGVLTAIGATRRTNQ